MSNITVNRKAKFDYHLERSIEAGIELVGTEVKSLRAGHASLQESFVEVRQGECWLVQSRIDPYKPSRDNHEPGRKRRLLLKKNEIEQLADRSARRGYTIVPVRMYFNGKGRVKLEIALAKGKHVYDKRRTIADRENKIATERAMKNHG